MTAWLAAVWRRSWKRSRPSPASAQTARQHAMRLDCPRASAWRGNLVAGLCHPATAQAYEDGYDTARVKAALRYPGTNSGYTGGWF